MGIWSRVDGDQRENVALGGETMTCSYDLTFILIHTDRGRGGWRMEPGGCHAASV